GALQDVRRGRGVVSGADTARERGAGTYGRAKSRARLVPNILDAARRRRLANLLSQTETIAGKTGTRFVDQKQRFGSVGAPTAYRKQPAGYEGIQLQRNIDLRNLCARSDRGTATAGHGDVTGLLRQPFDAQ